MPPRFLATVTCPSCGTRFQTPVEQILDVRVDPSAKNRVISGTVNAAVCPSCGTGGALNIPFVYHDPDEEIALLYLPVESGPNEVERQKAAGRLTRQLMEAMPPEERKGYLLQPETFISMESLVKRVLELEGISEEEMLHSQRQREFVAELLEASEDEWSDMVGENAELVDEGLFAFLEYVMRLSTASGQQADGAEKLESLHEYLVEETALGQQLANRSEIFQAFAEDPTRDSLLDALTQAPDEETVLLLVQSGISLMDYAFFQKLVHRIEEAESPEKKASLQKLRRTILDLREDLMQASDQAVRERTLLLSRLLATEDPVRMARSHLSELDELFFAVLGTELREAQQNEDQARIEELERVATAVNRVIEGTMPPEVALTRRLMAASDEDLMAQLRANRKQLTPEYLEFLRAVQQSMDEQGQTDAAERISRILTKAEQLAPAGGPPATPQAGKEAGEGPAEERTPSGLIIAKH